MKSRMIALLFVWTYCTALPAQDEPVVIPFQLRNNLIVFWAQVGEMPGYYLLDTGCEKMVLSDRFFTGIRTENTFYDINGKVTDLLSTFTNVQLAENWHFRDVKGVIMTLNTLEVLTGLPIAGVIGACFFQNTELVIDYDSQTITVYPLDRRGDSNSAFYSPVEPGIEAPFIGTFTIPVIRAEIAGKPLQLILDTGASLSVLDHRTGKKLVGTTVVIDKTLISGFNYSAKEIERVLLTDTRIGTKECPPMVMGLLSMANIKKNHPWLNIQGILGNDFLKNYRVAINFRSSNIRLWEQQPRENQEIAKKTKKIDPGDSN